MVVSDYGSRDGEAVREITEANGGVYARTEVDGPWSRSRALNAGIAAAQGSDADHDGLRSAVLPRRPRDGVRAAHARPAVGPAAAVPRPPGGVHAASIAALDWDAVPSHSTIRPRWGMGGMIAFRRDAYDATGGYDDRMEIYGGEDIDFAQRLRWAGCRHSWIDDPRARIFHAWHPSSRTAADTTPKASRPSSATARSFSRTRRPSATSTAAGAPRWRRWRSPPTTGPTSSRSACLGALANGREHRGADRRRRIDGGHREAIAAIGDPRAPRPPGPRRRPQRPQPSDRGSHGPVHRGPRRRRPDAALAGRGALRRADPGRARQLRRLGGLRRHHRRDDGPQRQALRPAPSCTRAPCCCIPR